MIPFEEIDERLKALGKDRQWLAKQSGRKARSIGDALAPNADPTKRSPLLQKALSDVIEAHEAAAAAQAAAPNIPQNLVLYPTRQQFNAWNTAFKHSDAETLEQWATEGLDEMAKAWLAQYQPATDLKVADAPNPAGPVSQGPVTYPRPGNGSQIPLQKEAEA